MDRSMRRADKMVTDRGWIEEVLRSGEVIHIAFASADGLPYVVPFNYGYKDDAIYIHGASKGLKNDLVAANGRVAFNVAIDTEVIRSDRAEKFSMKYKSVSGWGSAVELHGLEEKNHALRVLMDQYEGPYGDLTDANVGSVWVLRVDITKMTGKVSGYPKPEVSSD